MGFGKREQEGEGEGERAASLNTFLNKKLVMMVCGSMMYHLSLSRQQMQKRMINAREMKCGGGDDWVLEELVHSAKYKLIAID